MVKIRAYLFINKLIYKGVIYENQSTKKEEVNESLSGKISSSFSKVLRRILIGICLEAVIIGGVFAIMYSMNDNSKSAMKYTDGIDRAMQCKARSVCLRPQLQE